MATEPEWQPIFLSEPDVQGVEELTRFETVIRIVARVRPLEQWRTAREMRRRIRQELDRIGVTQSDQPVIDPDTVTPSPSDDDPGDNAPARG